MSSLLPIIIVAQIIFSAFVLKTSPTNITPLKDHVKNVLGVKIAQESTQTDTQETTQQSSEQQPDSQTASPENTAQTTNSQPATSQPESSSAPSSEQTTPSQPNTTNQPETNPQPAQETSQPTVEQNQPQNTDQTTQSSSSDTQQQINNLNQILEVSPTPEPNSPDQNQPSPSPQTEQSSISQNMAVLNPEELTSSSESINPQAITEVKKEEEALDKITDPGKQTEQFIINSIDKVKDINQEITKDDFASTNFASQRFNDQIDRALDNINSLPKAQAQKLQVQLTRLCKQADLILRNAELSVPEDLEQDIEINRGRCL